LGDGSEEPVAAGGDGGAFEVGEQVPEFGEFESASDGGEDIVAEFGG